MKGVHILTLYSGHRYIHVARRIPTEDVVQIIALIITNIHLCREKERKVPIVALYSKREIYAATDFVVVVTSILTPGLCRTILFQKHISRWNKTIKFSRTINLLLENLDAGLIVQLK